jgi:hypothetical protein
MHKLKLESLQVQSFRTTDAPPLARGTVQAHAKTFMDCVGTFGPQECGATNYGDCSGNCSYDCTYDCPLTEGPECYTMDPYACPQTEYLDCSMACTDFKTCWGEGTC